MARPQHGEAEIEPDRPLRTETLRDGSRPPPRPTRHVENVAVLRIPTFLAGGGIAQQVHDLVGEARARGAQGLIVDLRGNTGGSLAECDSSVSAFVPAFTRVARGAEGNDSTRVSRGTRFEDGRSLGGVRNPQGLDIPRLLQLYNEAAYSGVDAFVVREGVAGLSEDKRPASCVACHSCSAVCPQKIEVPETLAKFTEMLGESK